MIASATALSSEQLRDATLGAGLAGQRVDLDQVDGLQPIAREAKLDEPDGLLADREGPTGAHGAPVDEQRCPTLLEMLVVVVAGQDQERLAAVVWKRVEQRVCKSVLVDENDVRRVLQALEPRDERGRRVGERFVVELEGPAGNALVLPFERIVVPGDAEAPDLDDAPAVSRPVTAQASVTREDDRSRSRHRLHERRGVVVARNRDDGASEPR